jgi:hypothetical protein
MLSRTKTVLLFSFTFLLIISALLFFSVEKTDLDISTASTLALPDNTSSSTENAEIPRPAQTISDNDVDSDNSPVSQANTVASSSPSAENPNRNLDTANFSNTEARSEQSTSAAETPQQIPRVRTVIEEVQRRLMAQQVEEALNEMNALYTEFDELSPFEQATLLNFYTNALIAQEMWQESITAFALMRTIADLRTDLDSRAGLALGQLHSRIGEPDVALDYYREWLANPYEEERTAEQTRRVVQLMTEAESAIAN